MPGRLARLEDDLWQLRLEKPLLAADGDAVVIRRLSPPDTLGGGRVLDAAAVKHGRRPEAIARLRDRAAGRERSAAFTPPEPATEPMPSPLPPGSDELLSRLDGAGLALVNAAALEPIERTALRGLVDHGAAVRISGELYASAEVAEAASTEVVALITSTGSVSLAEVRDRLGTGRKSAQAVLEHLDALRVTRRRPDDRRVLRAGPPPLFLNERPNGALLRKAPTDEAAAAYGAATNGAPAAPPDPLESPAGSAHGAFDAGSTPRITHGP